MSIPAFFPAIVERMREAVFVRNLERKVIYVNAATERLLGWVQADVLNRTCSEIFGPNCMSDGKDCPFEGPAVATPGSAIYEHDLILSNGERKRLRISVTPFFDAAVAAGTISILEDLTIVKMSNTRIEPSDNRYRTIGEDVKTTKEELERRIEERTVALTLANNLLRWENEERQRLSCELERFRDALNSSSDSVFIFDPRTLRFVDVNETACVSFGYSRENLLKMDLSTITPLLPIDEIRRLIDPVIKGHTKTAVIETTHVRTDGTRFPVEIRLRFTSHAGTPFLVGIARDVTERSAAADRIMQAKEVAERANHAKSDFLSCMSHELRTPMNAILGFAQLLESDVTEPLTQSQRECIIEILNAGNHLLELINEILDLSRIESGKIRLSMESVNLHSLLDESIAMVEPVALNRHITIIREYSTQNPVCVSADRSRLRQVLLNLLSNAIKFNKLNGRVVIRTVMEKNERLRLSIADTGPGIPQEYHKTIFEPFTRISSELVEHEGAGVGLTIASRLMQAMNGSIGLESSPERGATFWIELIQAKTSKEQGIPLTGSATSSPSSILHEESANIKCILCVEDDPINLNLIRHLLRRLGNFSLLTATNGHLAIEMARAHKPALILMDINLPGLNGIDALRQLHADPGTAGIPVVAISGMATAADVQKGLDAGFDEYITKPIDIPRFRSIVSRILCFFLIPIFFAAAACFAQTNGDSWLMATASLSLSEERAEVARSLPTLLTSLPLFRDANTIRPDGRHWNRRDRMKSEHSKVLAGDRPRGLAIGLYHLFDNWYILESLWHGNASDTVKDHNLHLLDLGRNLLCGSVHQDGTHSLNADFSWYSHDGLLYMQGFSELSSDSGILYRFRIPPFVWKPDAQGFDSLPPVSSISKTPENAPSPMISPESISLRDAWYAVYPILEPREPDFSLSKKEFATDTLTLHFPDDDNGNPGPTFALPWKNIFGGDFSISNTVPRRRYPVERRTPDHEWTLRDSLSGGKLLPSWHLFDRFGRDCLLPFDSAPSRMGFTAAGIWILNNEQLYWGDSADIRSHTLRRYPFRRVMAVSEIGPDALLVTCSDCLIALQPRHGRGHIFLRRPHPDDEQSFWVSAWRISSGDFILSEQLESLGSGETGRLLRVRLKRDPFAEL
ncbi:MAG: PAS domain S-box protein [Candidatus Riflebacteria bacterium]|nr:PAS domain S-box protein [Candidatus Riflebacteria bacterium]